MADLGGDFSISVYVTADPILQLASALGAGQSAEFGKFSNYAKRFRFLIAGARKDGDSLISRLEVTLK